MSDLTAVDILIEQVPQQRRTDQFIGDRADPWEFDTGSARSFSQRRLASCTERLNGVSAAPERTVVASAESARCSRPMAMRSNSPEMMRSSTSPMLSTTGAAPSIRLSRSDLLRPTLPTAMLRAPVSFFAHPASERSLPSNAGRSKRRLLASSTSTPALISAFSTTDSSAGVFAIRAP